MPRFMKLHKRVSIPAPIIHHRLTDILAYDVYTDANDSDNLIVQRAFVDTVAWAWRMKAI
jgi:hypothetical protein